MPDLSPDDAQAMRDALEALWRLYAYEFAHPEEDIDGADFLDDFTGWRAFYAPLFIRLGFKAECCRCAKACDQPLSGLRGYYCSLQCQEADHDCA